MEKHKAFRTSPVRGEMHGYNSLQGGYTVLGRAALVNRYAKSLHLMRISWVVEDIKYETAR